MKRIFIAAGLLLVAAVFMSGCVTETEDPIVGIWNDYASEKVMDGVGVASTSLIFNADGTGFSLTSFAGELVSADMEFTWKNEGDGKYSLTRPDIWGGTGVTIPETEVLTLDGDRLTIIAGEYSSECRRQPVSEYILGLWATDVVDYEEYEDVTCLFYFAEDGTGNSIAYGSDVMGINDVYTNDFTWEEKDGVISILDDGDSVFAFTLKNGALYDGNTEAFHKYTVKDSLLGLWMSDEPSEEDDGIFDIVILIRSDGTGVELWTAPGSHVASAKYYFTWEMTGPTTYQAVYNDGDVWNFSHELLKLNDGEVTYSKIGYDVLAEYVQKVTA